MPAFYETMTRIIPILLCLVLTASAALCQKERIRSKDHTTVNTKDTPRILDEIKLSRDIHRTDNDQEREYFHAKNAVNEALALNDTLLYARALDNLGLLYRFHQQYAQAIDLHAKAFDLIKNMSVEPIYKMICANNAGVAARYFGKYDVAVLYYMIALKIAEKENDLKNIAISSNGLGNALGHIPKRQEEALAFFNRALEAEKLRNNSRGIAMNYLSISDYYIQKKEYRTARKYLTDLKKVNEDNNDAHGLAIADEFFGISYLKEGKDYDRALSYFKMSLEQFREINDVQKEGEILSRLGELSDKQNRPGHAFDYYHQSMALAKQANSRGLIMADAESLAKIYESRNNPRKALEYFKVAQIYKDSIDLSEQQIQIAALTTSYDIEKKESRIQLLEKEKKLRKEQLLSQQEKLKRQQTLFLLIVVSILSILIITLMQNRINKQNKKSALLLAAQEKERLQALYERNLAQAEMLASRMQINPHFLFNCLNAINYLIQRGESEKASKYLIVFSRFVRMVLETSKNQVVPLKEELALIGHYLTLEENRFDNDFSYHISVNDEEKANEALIPPLLLQPYVENAIWHGLLPGNKEKKELNIEVVFKDDQAKIIIEDNGVGRVNAKKYKGNNDHKSMGIRITQDRIDFFNKNYKSNIHCETVDKIDESGLSDGTRVILTLTMADQLISANP